MNIKDLFKRVIGALLKIGSKGEKALNQVEDLLPAALWVVQQIAAATPTKSDDEILSLARDYAFGDVALKQIASGNRDDVLRAIGRIALQDKVRMSLKDSLANTALELAYTIHKAQ